MLLIVFPCVPFHWLLPGLLFTTNSMETELQDFPGSCLWDFNSSVSLFLIHPHSLPPLLLPPSALLLISSNSWLRSQLWNPLFQKYSLALQFKLEIPLIYVAIAHNFRLRNINYNGSWKNSRDSSCIGSLNPHI